MTPAPLPLTFAKEAQDQIMAMYEDWCTKYGREAVDLAFALSFCFTDVQDDKNRTSRLGVVGNANHIKRVAALVCHTLAKEMEAKMKETEHKDKKFSTICTVIGHLIGMDAAHFEQDGDVQSIVNQSYTNDTEVPAIPHVPDF